MIQQFPVSRVLSAMTVLLKIITCPQYGVVHQPEIEPLPSAGEAQAPNHWIAMEFPTIQYF